MRSMEEFMLNEFSGGIEREDNPGVCLLNFAVMTPCLNFFNPLFLHYVSDGFGSARGK